MNLSHGNRMKELWERDMSLDEYKKYRVEVLKDLYIKLSPDQLKYLESLERHLDVDNFLQDIILNSEQNQGPSIKETIKKAYNREIVNRHKARRNAVNMESR